MPNDDSTTPSGAEEFVEMEIELAAPLGAGEKPP